MLIAPRARALTADELLLVVNKNQPESQQLAEFYAKARSVPDGRIVALDLPTTDDISFDAYERNVVPPIANFLREHTLDPKIKCLVTFYGVPLRIEPHKLTAHEEQELAELKNSHTKIINQLSTIAATAESIAKELDPTFQPLAPHVGPNGPETDALADRVNHAGEFVGARLASVTDTSKRADLERRFMSLVREFSAPRGAKPTTQPATSQAATSPTSQEIVAEREKLEQLQLQRFDPGARQQIRALAAKESGLYGYAKVVAAQIEYLSPQDTHAALDNELALLHWTFYRRPEWMTNPLNFRLANVRTPQVMMVMRLDAPTVQRVRDIISESVVTERDGLKGKVVLDARGINKTKAGGQVDPFGIVDDSIRQLASLLKSKTQLDVVLDNLPNVIPPGHETDVALYCGWYSPGKYVPGMRFIPGSVGYHIASFEMTSLHNNNEGWCRGMLNDGISATLGPVTEPYLHSFPSPMEFFPLLLTGKLTLAEVYWKTCPLVSWRIAMVGDPLYTPFKNHPALKIEDLPEPLHAVFAE
jgi:uncharacterized protein (TIGR03790 family)